MTKFNVGNVGDKVRILDGRSLIGNSIYRVTSGKEYEIVSFHEQKGSTVEHIKVADNHSNPFTICDYEYKYIELVEKKLTENQRITALENEVAELRPLKQEVAELKLIVHELRGKKSIEPSTTNTVEDIIEFEGEQYKKVEREAREGDVIVFYGSYHPQITDGKPYKVFKGENAKENKLIHVADSGTEYPVDGKYVDGYYVYELIKSKPITPNQQRAAIIEKAKVFVNKYGAKGVDFVVNTEHQAITAIYYDGKDVKKNSALCNPNDVFNEHIGKAIALGRALGLDVSEFEQAVQPTEFTKGQIVVGGSTYREPREVTKVTHDDHVYRKPIGGNDFDDSWCNAKYLTIINDTNAKYEVF